jgi:predicted HAD superfamily Cof-like phosphohydrolase
VNKMQGQVLEFHSKYGAEMGEEPGIRGASLRGDLIFEEYTELLEAIEANDLEKAIDALCDLLYVAFGAAVTFGIDIEKYFNEVPPIRIPRSVLYEAESLVIRKPVADAPPLDRLRLRARIADSDIDTAYVKRSSWRSS